MARLPHGNGGLISGPAYGKSKGKLGGKNPSTANSLEGPSRRPGGFAPGRKTAQPGKQGLKANRPDSWSKPKGTKAPPMRPRG